MIPDAKPVSLFRKAFAGTTTAEWTVGSVFLLFALGLLAWMIMDPASMQNAPMMGFIRDNNVMLLAPEIMVTIVIMACVLLLSFSKTREERQDIWWVATTGTAITLLCLVIHFFVIYPQGVTGEGDTIWQNRMVFYTLFNADLFSLVIRTLLVIGTLLVLLSSRQFINEKIEVPGEFYVLMLSALLGGMLLSGATDLIMLFVALETLSISSYIMAGYMRGNVHSAEAGLKYLLYGSMATAILLFGLSILYGLSGGTYYGQIITGLSSMPTVGSPLILAIMSVMIIGGIGFKLSAAPFHMWAPDTYEGSPTPVVAFLSVVSKIAAFSLAVRFFYLLFGPMEGWVNLLSLLAVLSMVIGNVVALTQRNIKRLLAYSTVAHVGYLLLGLVVLTQDGLSSLLYYLMTYLFMNLGAFAAVTYFETRTGTSEIGAYAGLVRKQPVLALLLSVMLLSLAGIPITAGFFGKFFLFQAVMNAGSQYLWLVIVALLTSTISLYYYLNVIRLMVIAEPSPEVQALPDQEPRTSLISAAGFALGVCLFGTLVLGIGAEPILTLSRQAVAEIGKQPMLGIAADAQAEKPSLAAKR